MENKISYLGYQWKLASGKTIAFWMDEASTLIKVWRGGLIIEDFIVFE